MKTKSISWVAQVVTLLFSANAPAVVPETEDGAVFINPWSDGGYYSISEGQVAFIRSGWIACKRGLVQAFINASHFQVVLEHEGTVVLALTPEEVESLWGQIEPSQFSDPGCSCLSGKDPYAAHWQYELPQDLAAGNYDLVTTIEIDHTVVDGADCDGDGKVERYSPEDLNRTTTNIVSVPLAIGWANLQWPPTISHTISSLNATENVYGQVWIDGLTSLPGPTDGLTAQLGYGPDGSEPEGNSDWVWVNAEFNVDVGNNDEFRANLLPEAVGTFDYAYRYSTDGGTNWLYADLDGTGNGYDPQQAGLLTVNSSGDTTPPATATNLNVIDASAAALVLAWDPHPNTDGDLAGFDVYRQATSASGYVRIGRVPDAAATDFSDNDVTPGATYNYYVVPFDTSFNFAPASNTATGTVPTL